MDTDLQLRLFWECRIKGKATFSEYKLLAEWLGVYEYVLPASRAVLPALQIHLAATLPTRKLIHTLWDIESCIPSHKQELLI